MGFRGSFPHFRRTGDARIDLPTFQFYTSGGQFVVEIGQFPPEGSTSWGGFVPPGEVRTDHLRNRLGLGSTDESHDHWSNFESEDYATTAAAVRPYLQDQAVR